MICEYCSKPFTPEDSPNFYLLKIGQDRKNISVCRTCYGDVLSLPEQTTSVKLYKVSSYSFPKDGSRADRGVSGARVSGTAGTVPYTRGLPAHLRKAPVSLDLVVKDSCPKKRASKTNR